MRVFLQCCEGFFKGFEGSKFFADSAVIVQDGSLPLAHAEVGADCRVVIEPAATLAAGLRRKIAVGSLSPGARMPSVRALAKASDVSPFTAARVYDVLVAEGLVEAEVTAHDQRQIRIAASAKGRRLMLAGR